MDEVGDWEVEDSSDEEEGETESVAKDGLLEDQLVGGGVGDDRRLEVSQQVEVLRVQSICVETVQGLFNKRGYAVGRGGVLVAVGLMMRFH